MVRILDLFKGKKTVMDEDSEVFVEQIDEDENDLETNRKIKVMPSKETTKSNYPPCNRAFALRMMNPMSYSQNHQSPLDGEIQPVVKKSIAKSIDGKRHTDNSFDDVSLSPASSLASFQDNMELYDIDEHDHVNGIIPDQSGMRLNRSFESSRPRKSARSSTTGKVVSNGLMNRSYSSDGFTGNFTRGVGARQSTPVRVRSTSSSEKAARNGSPSPRKSIRPDVSNYLEQNSATKDNNGSLRRSQSLRDRSRPTVNVRVAGGTNQNEQKSNQLKIRVASTRSSELRAKKINSSTSTTKITVSNKQDIKSIKPKQPRKISSSSKNKNVGDESDSSIIVHSEREAYNPRNYPRNVKNGKLQVERLERHDSTLSEASSIDSYDSALQMSSPSTPSAKPVLYPGSHTHFSLPSYDLFSEKLTAVCNVITERYPGDFQLLETLVEMQAAYEERNELVTTTVSQLRNKCYHLETKLSKGPNIPGMVIPLMRATTNFQQQLQSIMDAQQASKSMIDKSIQVSESTSELNSETAFHEITCEANNIVEELEKLSFNSSQSTSSPRHEEGEILESSPPQVLLPNGSISDASESYAIINELDSTDA